MKKIYAFNNKRNYQERPKAGFSVTLQNNQGDQFVPLRLKKFFLNTILSPDEQLMQEDGQSLLQKQYNEEKDSLNRRMYLIRNKTPGSFDIKEEGPSNSSQVSQNLQRTTPPEVVDEQVERVIESINPASKLLQQLITPQNLNLNTHLTYPCTSSIHLDVHARTDLEFKNKVALLSLSFTPETLQDVPTPQVLIAILKALQFQKLFPNLHSTHLKVPFFERFYNRTEKFWDKKNFCN